MKSVIFSASSSAKYEHCYTYMGRAQQLRNILKTQFHHNDENYTVPGRTKKRTSVEETLNKDFTLI